MFSEGLAESVATAGSSFALIALAETGDKSQIVCMSLAVRHRALPVLVGAVVAFAILNLLAVLFGAALENWLPENALYICVAVLFAIFGIHSLRAKGLSENESVAAKSDRNILIATFLLIFVAEFGDKTQIAVAGLSSAADPASVWIGSTLALTATSAMGVLAGRTVLQRIPMILLHRQSGAIFLILAAVSIGRIFYD